MGISDWWESHKGCCLESLRKLEDKSIDLVLTDPPYGNSSNFNWDNKYEPEWWNMWWKEIGRVIKENTPIIMFSGGSATFRFQQQKKKWYKHQYIWVKNVSHGHITSPYKPLTKHEIILVFNQGTYQLNQISKTGCLTSILGYNAVANGQKEHSAQKPIILLADLVRIYSKEGDTVLDTFAGSGPTAQACYNTGRKVVLMEKDKGFYENLRERCKNIDLVDKSQKDMKD